MPTEPACTEPAVTDASGSADAADDFCVHDSADIATTLRRLVGGDVPVTLSSADGLSYATALWAEDASGDLLVFSAHAGVEVVQALARLGAARALAELDGVDVQFDLTRLRLVRGRDSCALHAAYPTQMRRYQRRGAYRVKPLDFSHPALHLRHPGQEPVEMSLAVLDLSHGGLSVRLPDDMPALSPGAEFDGLLELDGMAEVRLALRVVRLIQGGRQVGCEITHVAPHDARALQRYIDHTQRRRRMLVL